MDALDNLIREFLPAYGTNAGHGHVWKRPDDSRARCGGPRMCAPCARDAAALADAREAVAGKSK